MHTRLPRRSRPLLFLLCVVFALIGVSVGPLSWPVSVGSAQSQVQATQKNSEPASGTPQADQKGRSDHPRKNTATTPNKTSTEPPGDMELTEKSPAAYDPRWDRDYPQDQRKKLLPFPDLRPGDIPPVKLYLYGGPGNSSYASLDDVPDFKQFYERLSNQKAVVMERWKAYLDTRYAFTGKTDSSVTMTRGKPVPIGPVVKLPAGIKSWEELANLTPEEIYKRDLFPEGFRPLSHPLQSTGHMLFPAMWLIAHPE